MFAVKTATVDNQGRIAIPRSIVPVVPWIREAAPDAYPIGCFVMPGAAGGIQVISRGGRFEALRAEASEFLSKDPPEDNEAAKEWMHLVRLLAGGWSSTITVPGKPKLQIPKDCGVLDFEHRTEVVVFASGSILEIWNREPWNLYLATVTRNATVQRGLRQSFARTVEPGSGAARPSG